MDITLKVILRPQYIQCLIQKLHGQIRIPHYAGTQEQTFYIISPVKSNGQITDFPGRKRGPRHIITSAIDTIFAVVDAFVGQQNLQQRNTTPIRTKAVTDSGFHTVSDTGTVIFPVHTAGCAGHIIFCRIRQDLQFSHQVHWLFYCGKHTKTPLYTSEQMFVFCHHSKHLFVCKEVLFVFIHFSEMP